MKPNIKLTTHSKQRAWERFRMDASQLKYYANKAVIEGINAFTDETLRPLCLPKALKHNSSAMYLLDGKLYAFTDNLLTTVMPLNYLDAYQARISS